MMRHASNDDDDGDGDGDDKHDNDYYKKHIMITYIDICIYIHI